MSTVLEEISLNAWPALQTVLYDGWVLRFANGYTRRANSVNPIYHSTFDIEEKLNYCESLYRERKLPVIYKISPLVFPPDLEERLAERGYRKEAPTSVQTMDLSAAPVQVSPDVVVQEELSDAWLDSYCRMNTVPETRWPTLQQILLHIMPRHCFVRLEAGSEVVACGLGVLQSGYVGLFDIVTHPALRKQGFGGQVVNSILAWGKQHGAQKGYLQVMLDNAPALSLYARIGFEEQYRYWYRVQ